MNRQEILDLFYARHTCKLYDGNRKISAEDFQIILESGRLSPSSFGFEPWHFLVVQSETLKKEIAEIAWGFKEKVDCSHLVIYLARTVKGMHPDSEYLTKIMHDTHKIPKEALQLRRDYYRNYIQNDNPILNNPQAMADWASKQVYIALGNMMTVARMLDIDSTAVEGMNYAKINELAVKKGWFNPEEFTISVMCAFGYRAKEPRPKTRQTLEQITTFLD